MTAAAADDDDDDGSIIEIYWKERELPRLLLYTAVTVASVPFFATAVAVGVAATLLPLLLSLVTVAFAVVAVVAVTDTDTDTNTDTDTDTDTAQLFISRKIPFKNLSTTENYQKMKELTQFFSTR